MWYNITYIMHKVDKTEKVLDLNTTQYGEI